MCRGPCIFNLRQVYQGQRRYGLDHFSICLCSYRCLLDHIKFALTSKHAKATRWSRIIRSVVKCTVLCLPQMHITYSDVVFSTVVEDLKKLPAPEVAVKYYTSGDLYLFGKFFCFSIFVSVSWNAVILDLTIPPNFIQMNFKLPDLPILEGQK